MSKALLLLAMLFLAPAVGCSTTHKSLTVAPGTQPTQEAASHKVRNEFLTTTSPTDAASDSGEAIMKKFGFRSGSPNTSTGYVDGDYFSAKAVAESAGGAQIEIDCEWIKDGQTRVVLTSDLPAAQHAVVASEVRRALNAAATRPGE